MRPIGFSTGALAHGDFRRAFEMLKDERVCAVELSALRAPEWLPLLDALGALDLSSFDYVSIHLPSAMSFREEVFVAEGLWSLPANAWPLVLHPDAIGDPVIWRELGDRICIENMDKRKPVGRTEQELDLIFRELPDARLCFDIGHARQIDPTMNEAYGILKRYREKIVQIHVSEVNSNSRHDILSYSTMESFRDVAHLLPIVPLILETPVSQGQMRQEINKVRFALFPAANEIRVA